jgi:deoxyribodipyrimidine photo-lyase
MGWPERPIFGKVRYMNYDGCKRKFAIGDFVARFPLATINAEAARSVAGGATCLVDHRHFTMRRKRKLKPTTVVTGGHSEAFAAAQAFIAEGALRSVADVTGALAATAPDSAVAAAAPMTHEEEEQAAAAAAAAESAESEEQAAKRLHLIFNDPEEM